MYPVSITSESSNMTKRQRLINCHMSPETFRFKAVACDMGAHMKQVML
jgi:hypothetical protein